MSAEVVILMGSDSDLSVMCESAKILENFGIEYEMSIISAHRTPERFVTFVKGLEERGVKVLIAGAGGAAHLPGMAAALTVIPVIGVPVKTAALGGVDSLYSIVQMPSGIPVATVAINGAANAGILAAKMIALGDPELTQKLKKYSAELGEKVNGKAEKLESSGWRKYLEERS